MDIVEGESKGNDKLKKYPLRINHYTVVMVTADKCNEDYANKLRTKYKNSVGKTSLKDITL